MLGISCDIEADITKKIKGIVCSVLLLKADCNNGLNLQKSVTKKITTLYSWKLECK